MVADWDLGRGPMRDRRAPGGGEIWRMRIQAPGKGEGRSTWRRKAPGGGEGGRRSE